MTTHPTTPTGSCPRPCWTYLRDTAPHILDDLTDAWARIEALTLISDRSADTHLAGLRGTIEHLGTLVEDHLGSCTAHDGHDPFGPEPEPPPVFQPGDWHTPAPGRWEAATLDHDPDTGRPAFEATIETDDYHPWHWTVYRANGDHLDKLADGQSMTLDHAQHHADTQARRWRDNPARMERAHRLRRIHDYGHVTCGRCTTSRTLTELIQAGSCPTPGCGSHTFHGFTLDELAAATEDNT